METLIVLGVTAILFVSALAGISGRQNRIQFSQGMREIEAMIRDVLNDVSNGFYPTVPGLICTADTSNGPPRIGYNSVSPTDTTGTKADCVFAGKVLQFGTDTDTTETTAITYSLAGRRLNYVGVRADPVTTFAQLKPAVVDSRNTNNLITPVSSQISQIDIMTETTKLPYGIQIILSNKNIGGRAIGIFYRDFKGIAASGQQASGTTGTAVARVTSAAGGLSAMRPQAVIEAADSLTASSFLAPTENLALCFKSATTDQTATITIGQGVQGNLRLDYDVNLAGVTCV